MQINITKKTFLCFGVVLLLCFTSFLSGRFLRFKRVSGNSERLEQGIILSGDSANRVLDELGIARSSIQSSTELGYAISKGIGELCKSNETARVCLDEINREITITQQNIETLEQSFTGVFDSMELGFKLAEEQANAYERIVETLYKFNIDTSENEPESTTGFGNNK